MMTQAMLAVYPDLFKAGSARAGVPAGCSWSGSCDGGSSEKTAEEWGNLVRGINPDYDGPRPRVLLFHGMSDTTMPYFNMEEAILRFFGLVEFDCVDPQVRSCSDNK